MEKRLDAWAQLEQGDSAHFAVSSGDCVAFEDDFVIHADSAYLQPEADSYRRLADSEQYLGNLGNLYFVSFIRLFHLCVHRGVILSFHVLPWIVIDWGCVSVAERKLAKLKEKAPAGSSAEKRDLLLSLVGAREGHFNRFLDGSNSNSVYDNIDNEITSDDFTLALARHIAPHKQAICASELVQLVKSDQLLSASSQESIESENDK